MKIDDWVDIPEYEGIYQVNSIGQVRSTYHNGKLLKMRNSGGYYKVRLYKEGRKPRNVFVHRLVASAFVPNIDNKPMVNHKNGQKTDNRYSNLEWVTNKENVTHSFKVLGRKFSDEWRKNKSEEMKRRIRNDENFHRYRSKKCICVETGVVFDKVKDALSFYGLSDATFYRNRKQNKSCKGYTILPLKEVNIRCVS